MCAKIVNLNELVGEDIVFEYGTPTRRYSIPADIETGTVFELFEMFTGLTKIEGDSPEELFGEVKEKFLAIRDRLLKIFQVRDPKLRELPFGVKATGIVLRHVLSELGVGVAEDPQPPTPRKPAPRSSGSRTSRTNSRKKR